MALTAKKVYAILKRQISDMEAKIKTPIIYRGTVATADLLPLNPDIGDMYNIESKSVYGEAGMNVAWNGVVWDTMGAPIDMSLYIKSSELADWVKQQNKPTYTAEEVGALPDTTVIPSKTSELQNDAGFLTKIPDNYLSGTDKTLSASGKAADAKAVGDKNVELLADILSKLDKNQGSENSGKIAGINESGDIVPMFPVSVDYNEETNCLEFGSDQKMELNKGINLDSTLTKTGYAADAGAVGEITNSLKEDLRQNTEQNFFVIKKSYNSADYAGHTIDINIAPIIGHSKVIIEASIKSYGYFTAYTANGTLKNGVEIPNQICNIGDLKIASGFTNEQQTAKIIIYSANDVSVDITIKIAKKFEIIVSQDGRGDFDNLDDALNYASDDEAHSAVIIVRPGIYNMRTETPTDIPYKKENRYLTIIGEDKYKCIIRNDNGYYSNSTEDSGGQYYDSTPLRLGGDVTIQNLTVISSAKNYAQWVSEHPEVKGVDLGQSYCIHHDMDTNTKNTCLIKDCILVNDHYDAIGAGNRPNHTIQVENCEITTTTDFSVAGAKASAEPIFIHSYNLNSGNAYENQNIVIKNNILINTNQNDACYFYASNPDSMNVTLIGNVCKTADTASGFRSYGDAFGVYKTDLCFGNNIETMNN